MPEVARRLLRATGIATYLVDTGLPGDLTGPAELAAAGAAQAREIVRLEPLAQQVADTSGTVDGLLAHLAEAVHGAAASAAAFASRRAVRLGLPHTSAPPGPGEVRGAAGRWLARRRAGDRLTDPVLLRHLLWIAVATGRPLQLHAGGTRAAPLGDFAAATGGLGTDLVLLDGSPGRPGRLWHLAHTFRHVYVDVGPTGTGARGAALLADALDAAPFGKLLFSSGAQGLPELHVVAALGFREALGRVLADRVRDGPGPPRTPGASPRWSPRERASGVRAA